MLIPANFLPSNFEIFDFYGEETCFAWSKNKLVAFPYSKFDITSALTTHLAPRDIRSLRCFNGRVFVLCEPVGVYKLLKTFKFSALCSAGIANGPVFYEVFLQEDNWLVSQNRSTKVNRKLFQLEPEQSSTSNLRDITIGTTNSELSLRRAIHATDDDYDEDICIVAIDKRVFKITQTEAQLIYRSEHNINDIVGIFKGESILGIVLTTRDAAVLVYAVQGKLVFDKVFLDSEVQGLCAGVGKGSEDVIWLAHIDGTRIHYWVRTIRDNTFGKTKTETSTFLAIKNYKNKNLICLTEEAELFEIKIESFELKKIEQEEFIVLKSEMLQGTEGIVNAICERAKELQRWNEELLEEQERLRRINIYSHKQNIVCLPEIRVERIARQLFVRFKFDGVLPLSCFVVVGMIFDQRVHYCIKYVEESETTVDLSLGDSLVDEETSIQVDLITLVEESKAWCLIRNFTKKPQLRANPETSSDRINFIQAKLAALRNLAKEREVTMKKLSAIKKSIRRELKNL